MSKKIIAITLAVLIFVVVLSACGNSSSPERTAEKYFSAVKAGDLDKAMSCFTPAIQEQYKAALSLSNTLFGSFGLGLDSGSLLGGLVGAANTDAYKNYDFKVSGSAKTDDTHATVTVDVYIDGNKNSTTTVYCIKIDGEWYIEK